MFMLHPVQYKVQLLQASGWPVVMDSPDGPRHSAAAGRQEGSADSQDRGLARLHLRSHREAAHLAQAVPAVTTVMRI
jgi:hypothetical protein